MILQVIPAIDLMNGQCVRLKQGLKNSKKIYSNDPIAMAQQWQKAGASLLHVVNLDGAFGQADENVRAITDILHHVTIPIELGGGIRSLEDAAKWLALGIARVIFGTIAVTHPSVIRQAIVQFGTDPVIVGVDAKEDKIAIKGWEEQSEKLLLPFVHELEVLGLQQIIYTDVARDGEANGPNLKKLEHLCRNSRLQIIASGGFSKTEHFSQLASLGLDNIKGAILGTALYEGNLDLSTLIESFERVK
jgi:phosphoribosylformimino-5-aminoimidazole carboxamide ribotide isomerase